MVNLLDEDVRVEQVETSKGTTGLRLAEERVRVGLVGRFENVLVVGQRLRQCVDDVVDGYFLHFARRLRSGAAHADAAIAQLKAGVVLLAVAVRVT